MIRKKLSPLIKPSNLNQIANNGTLAQCLVELIKQQKITNQILQTHFNPYTHNKNQESRNSQQQRKLMSLSFQAKLKQNKNNNTQPSLQQKQSDFYYPNNKFNQNQIQNSNLGPNNRQSPFKNLESQKILNDALKKKISNPDQKKNYNVLSQFLPYTDRRQFKFLVDFANITKQFPVISGIQILQQITIQWIGDVLRMAASMCWNMMLNGFLNYEQTKILFTQNIIFNYIHFMKEIQQRNFGQFKHRLTILINKKSINVLDFLGKQYPQTKIEVPNIRLKQILPNINNSMRLKFDLIAIANRKGFQLKYKPKGVYSSEVMTMINFMIDQTNEQYPIYQKQCLHIFQQLFRIPQKRDSPTEGNNFLNAKTPQSFDSGEDLMYRQKTKKYIKFLIGRKINKNVPKYTRQQINNGIFFAKSPSILRILTKWVQQLTQIIKKPEDFIFSADRQLKSHDGNFVVLFSSVRKAVCQKIIQKRTELFKKIQQIKQECAYIQSILSSSKYTVDQNQTHLSEDQIAVGKFSVYLQKAISSYIFVQLNLILHFLLSIPYQVDQNKVGVQEDFYRSQIRKQLDKLNLVSMKIFDLLRCKCISNQQDIIWLMKYLIQRNRVDDFKLIRVKDRLSQGTRDINCNIRFAKGGMLSQMQLSVVSNIESKQQKLDSYNHFLYELKRSKLGPLSQNVSIWTVLEQRSQYFQTIAKNPIPIKPIFHTCSNENLQKFIKPISCQSCNNFYPYPQTCYSNVKCKKCKKTYCGDCYSIVLSENQKKTIIFEGLFKQSVMNHIVFYNDHQKPFPLQGVFFKRYHQRRELNFFTVLIKDSKTQQPLSQQKVKQLASKQSQLECQILFTHNSLRNGKTIEKQKNTKNKIKGIYKKQKGLFINKKDFEFFNQYLIFYFDSKFQASKMTLEQIETFLRNQQNYKIKVLNIMQDPVYVDQIQFLRKKSQKVRQLFNLKSLFANKHNKKFVVYQFKNIFIVAKVHKDPLALGASINYDNNISKLKQFATTQKSIVSMQKTNMKYEIQNIQNQLSPKLVLNLQNNLRKAYFNYNKLQSIKGLKKFTHIEVLYLRHNMLKNLQGVQDMKYLMVLRFDDNQVQNIEALSNSIGLKRLMGIDNQIKSIECLKNLELLKTVQFQRNDITSLQPIKNLTELQDINFKNNPNLSQIPLFVSKYIKFINFSKTNIKDFSSLGNYTKLDRLMLEHLGLRQIPAFIKSMKLNELWLGNNQIQKISNLQEQQQLQLLSLKKNKIKQISNLQGLQRIRNIYLDNNQLTTLYGLKCCFQTLKSLSVKENPLQNIKQLVYTDQTFKFQFSKDQVPQNVAKYYEQLFISKINSSGSED